MKRWSKVKDFPVCQDVIPTNYLRLHYIRQMQDVYNSAKLLYSISPSVIEYFHYQILSSLRILLELLIRFQQEIREDAVLNSISTRFDEMPWSEKLREKTKNLYSELCLSIHGQYSKARVKAYEKQKSESDNQEILETLKRFYGEKEGIKILTQNGMHLDKHCLELLNEFNLIIYEVLDLNHYINKEEST